MPEPGGQDSGHCECGGQYHCQAGGLHPLYLGRPGNCSGHHQRVYHPAVGAVPVCSIRGKAAQYAGAGTVPQADRGTEGPAQADAAGFGHESPDPQVGEEVSQGTIHVLHRPKYGLCRCPGGGTENEGNFLHSRGVLCCRGIEAWDHRLDPGKAAGNCPVLQSFGDG